MGAGWCFSGLKHFRITSHFLAEDECVHVFFPVLWTIWSCLEKCSPPSQQYTGWNGTMAPQGKDTKEQGWNWRTVTVLKLAYCANSATPDWKKSSQHSGSCTLPMEFVPIRPSIALCLHCLKMPFICKPPDTKVNPSTLSSAIKNADYA